jgi:MHS family proline/betaine transporter-like MFS transporter
MLKHKAKWRIIAAGIIGNVIEYYDFALIGFLAPVVGALFFPSNNEFLSILGSLGAFAAGMIMRPIGAIVFGHIGDKKNRKHALFGSLILMALPTFFIGFLPTFAQIGIAAPVLLVILRMIQGFSVGGEYASSIVYLVEEAPKDHQNLYGSFVSLGAKLGMAIGSAMCGFLLLYYGEKEILEWAWRVPFLASMVLAIIGLMLRRSLENNYEAPKSKQIPLFEILKNFRYVFWSFLILASAIWMLYYTLFIYLPLWLETYGGLSKKSASGLNTFSIVLGVILIPTFALIADKIGSLKLIKISAISTAIFILPIFWIMTKGDMVLTSIAVTLMTTILCAFQAPIFALTVNALPIHNYRASFTAIILGSAAGIVGGSTPALMATITKISGMPTAPAFLIALFAIIGWRALGKISSLQTK